MNMSNDHLKVKRCDDFVISGKGDHPNWDVTSWIDLSPLDKLDSELPTRFKILYSPTGIYVLFHCTDQIISTDYQTDQGDLWNGDVVEVFLQPDEKDPLYFEYEINALNKELVLLIPNNQGDFMGWAPWHYEGDRKVKKAVYIEGGQSEPGAEIKSWKAEMFFPYTLFKGIKNVPPQSGKTWKANFYRMDFDTGQRIKWSWKSINTSFHEFEKFGTILFE